MMTVSTAEYSLQGNSTATSPELQLENTGWLPTCYGKALGTLFLCVLSLTSLITNSLLIWIIIRSSQLRTRTNAFIVSIACSDIIFSICVVLPTAIFLNITVPLPQSCQVIGLFSILTQTATSFSLMMVSIDRCIAVAWSLKYSHLITNTKVVVMISITWTLSVAFSFMPILGWGHFDYHPRRGHCTLQYNGSQAYVITQRMVCMIVPGCLILVSMAIILRSAYAQRRIFAIMPMPGLAFAVSKQPIAVSRRSTLSAMKTLFLIVVVISVLWLPWMIIDFVHFVLPEDQLNVDSKVLRTTYYIGYLSCILNPFVFLSNKKYKERLGDLMSKLRKKPACHKGETMERMISQTTTLTPLPSMSSLSLESVRPQSRALFINTKANTLQIPTFINVAPAQFCESKTKPIVTSQEVPEIIVSSVTDDGESIIEERKSRRSGLDMTSGVARTADLSIRVPRVSLSTI